MSEANRIREVAHGRDAALRRAQALADTYNREIFVLHRFISARGRDEFLLSSERRVPGWAYSGVVISQAMLDAMN